MNPFLLEAMTGFGCALIAMAVTDNTTDAVTLLVGLVFVINVLREPR